MKPNSAPFARLLVAALLLFGVFSAQSNAWAFAFESEYSEEYSASPPELAINYHREMRAIDERRSQILRYLDGEESLTFSHKNYYQKRLRNIVTMYVETTKEFFDELQKNGIDTDDERVLAKQIFLANRHYLNDKQTIIKDKKRKFWDSFVINDSFSENFASSSRHICRSLIEDGGFLIHEVYQTTDTGEHGGIIPSTAAVATTIAMIPPVYAVCLPLIAASYVVISTQTAGGFLVNNISNLIPGKNRKIKVRANRIAKRSKINLSDY